MLHLREHQMQHQAFFNQMGFCQEQGGGWGWFFVEQYRQMIFGHLMAGKVVHDDNESSATRQTGLPEFSGFGGLSRHKCLLGHGA
jgi:hypothetical protein